MIRKIGLLVGNKPVGVARTWAYPNGDSRVHFRIPLYHLTVSGLLDNSTPDQRVFDVLRFGVTKEASKTQPHVVGLAELQTHTIQSWQPTYKVHSAATAEIGAWQVYANFLIHDGPDEPTLLPVYATIG
ncbi:MAG: hypothetical protein HY080_03795, partial [Gammaproteobacteria bacterium]|nr:hypothetical protein [Gammaproteobacteria bacterium]